MKIGFFQFEVKLGGYKENIDMLTNSLTQEKFDLLVLPELFTTGYLFDSARDLQKHAEALTQSPTVKVLHDICDQTGGYIIGNIPENIQGHIFNSAIIVGPDGLIGKQQKMHLTTYEKSLFSPGSGIFVFRIKDATIGVVSCFDLWFPEMTRLLAESKVDILVSPCAFGGEESLVIHRTRAMENRLFAVLCNQTGVQISQNMKAKFRGESRIVAPDGKLMFAAEKGKCLHFEEVDLDLARTKSSVLSEDFRKEWCKYQINYFNKE